LSDKLLLALASTQQFLFSSPVGTHDDIFLFKTAACFEMGPPFQREEGTVGQSVKLLLELSTTDIFGFRSRPYL
jgi:hypothetical protein